MMGYGSCLGWGGALGGGWMAGGWLALLVVAILAALVVVGIALAMRPGGRSTQDSREILRLRFARGEISADEFAQANRVIGS